MKLRYTGLLLTAAVFSVTACGQKGPLYLPRSDTAVEDTAPAGDASDTAGTAVDTMTENGSSQGDGGRTDK